MDAVRLEQMVAKDGRLTNLGLPFMRARWSRLSFCHRLKEVRGDDPN